MGESYEQDVLQIVQQIMGKYDEIEQQKRAIEQLAYEEKQILETASAYREKKAKPLFIRMKNKIAALAAKLEQT